jgi:regulator of cell morphogenesis and NO signaling
VAVENVDLDSSVPDWLIEYPVLLSLFCELGIDYCCGGKSLRTACQEQGLRPEDVLARCESWPKNSEDPG